MGVPLPDMAQEGEDGDEDEADGGGAAEEKGEGNRNLLSRAIDAAMVDEPSEHIQQEGHEMPTWGQA